jgi:hypothetical protein
MRHPWKKPFHIKCFSPLQGGKIPESNMSLWPIPHIASCSTTPRNMRRG